MVFLGKHSSGMFDRLGELWHRRGPPDCPQTSPEASKPGERSVRGFFTAAGIILVLALTLPACGNDHGDQASAKAGGPLFAANCASCHGPEAAGGIGPNITSSTSAGIGTWSEEDFFRAVRTGVDDEGETLCDVMPRFSSSTLSDTQLASIYDYLRTLVNDTENAGTACP
jgi:mono/diheme cytochrome c family protein